RADRSLCDGDVRVLGLEEVDHLPEECGTGIVTPPGHLQLDLLVRVELIRVSRRASRTAGQQEGRGDGDGAEGRTGTDVTRHCASFLGGRRSGRGVRAVVRARRDRTEKPLSREKLTASSSAVNDFHARSPMLL